MTTCPQCGLQNRADAVACQRCGAPLAQTIEHGAPGWLRQLQSTMGSLMGSNGQPSNAPAFDPRGASQRGMPSQMAGPPQQQAPQQQQSFAAGNLVSDDALPEWLRGQDFGQAAPQQQASQIAGWPTNRMPAAAPAWDAAPANRPPAPPASAYMGGNGTTAASALFDESAFPDWLKQAARGQEVESQPGYSPQAPAPNGNGYPGGYGAGFGQQPPQAGMGYPVYQQPMGPGSPFGSAAAPGYPAPSAFPPSSAFPGIENAGATRRPPSVPPGLAGPSLVDPAALPQWLGGQPGAPATNGYSGGQQGNGNMAAQSLIDETALPQWLRAEPNTNTGAFPAAPNAGMPRPAPTRLDEPLPAWLNQVYVEANVPRIDTRASAPDPRGIPGPSPMGNAVAAHGFGGGPMMSAPGGSGGLTGSDFVDESALPEWLRTQGAQPMNGVQAPSASIAPAAPPSAGFSPQSPAAFFQAQAQQQPAPAYQPALPPAAGGQQPSAGSFSASDLIDPAALPGWVQGEEPQVATFSSTAGWTSQRPAIAPAPSAGIAEMAGTDGGAMGDMGRMNADMLRLEQEQTARVEAPPEAARRAQQRRRQPRAPEPPARPAMQQPPAPWGDEPESAGRMPDSVLGGGMFNERPARRPAAPIPREELPSWLRRDDSPRGAQNPSHANQPPQQDWWAEEQFDQGQQLDWDDGNPYGGYGEGGDPYGGEAQWNEPRQEKQRGAIRRFFGRK